MSGVDCVWDSLGRLVCVCKKEPNWDVVRDLHIPYYATLLV